MYQICTLKMHIGNNWKGTTLLPDQESYFVVGTGNSGYGFRSSTAHIIMTYIAHQLSTFIAVRYSNNYA